MTHEKTRTMLHLHAELLTHAGDLERRAERCSDQERIDQLRDDAADMRDKAAALAELLIAAGVDVSLPPPGQMQLFSDGAMG